MSVAQVSASHMRPDARFQAWQDALAGFYDVQSGPAGETFQGHALGFHLGSLLVGKMEASVATYERSRRRIRLDGLDHLIVGLRHEGTDTHLTIQDMARPFEMADVSLGGFCLIVPRHRLHMTLKTSDSLHGLRVSSAATTLLGTFLSALETGAPQLRASQAPFVADAALELVTAAVQATRSGDALRLPPPSKKAAAKQYIEAHLDTPTLNAAMVAQAIAVSRSVLYRLLAAEGGVERYILHRRLLRAQRRLQDSTDRIADIAHRGGFSSESQFTRAFRAWAGVPPRVARTAPRLCRESVLAEPHAIATFSTWVRTLR